VSAHTPTSHTARAKPTPAPGEVRAPAGGARSDASMRPDAAAIIPRTSGALLLRRSSERRRVQASDARPGRHASVSPSARQTPARYDEQACGHRACRSSRGPCGDARNNPCRRQGDQVVAPSSTGRRLLVEDDHGASRGRRYRAARLGGGRRRRPVVLSQGARPRMGVPVAEGSARRRLGRSRDGRPRARFAPAFARGCGRPHTPGRRARLSSPASVRGAVAETPGSTRTAGARWCARRARGCSLEAVAGSIAPHAFDEGRAATRRRWR
jgi:hypothetical protein